MNVLKKKFTCFLQEYGARYPCNEIPSTRQGFRCKWLLIQGGNAVLRRESDLYAIPSSSFDRPTFIHLIVTRQALPLTPQMDQVMDWMDSWGRGISSVWYDHVVDLFCLHLEEETFISNEILLKEVVYLHMEKMVWDHFLAGDDLGHYILDEWHAYFNQVFHHSTKDFFYLATKSIFFVRAKIEHATPQIPSRRTLE